jgi:hypothetical protein
MGQLVIEITVVYPLAISPQAALDSFQEAKDYKVGRYQNVLL